MKLIINLSEEVYKNIQSRSTEIQAEGYTMENVILNGTPIPDNATVGEVFCMLAYKEPICETASYFTIDKNLWNSPYQKGDKNECV